METYKESNRAKKAALLAAKSCESEETAIRISAIRNFVNQVNSIMGLIKSHVEGLSAKEIARQLNIEIGIVIEELKWFQQSKIITQKGKLWIHKKYE